MRKISNAARIKLFLVTSMRLPVFSDLIFITLFGSLEEKDEFWDVFQCVFLEINEMQRSLTIFAGAVENLVLSS